MAYATDSIKDEGKTDLGSVHKTALERFKLAAEAESDQRLRELEALKFAAGEHWPEEVKKLRQGDVSLGLNSRPMLTIDLLRQPIQQLENQQKQARLAVTVNPKGRGASKKTAEMLQGLYRNIEVESRANLARGWAYARAIKAGRGFYRVRTDYANDGDFDQDIIIDRVLNQGSVYLDPFAQQPDWSDGDWGFIVSDVPLGPFKREYPKSKIASMGDSELIELGNDVPGWISFDGASRAVRVAEYFYVEYTERVLEMGERSRTVKDRKVCWVKMTGAEVLDKQDWPGRYIPIIPVIANEENIDGERQWDGIVKPAMDSSRVFDYQTSLMVETTALAPRSPFIIAEGQNEGYEQMWQTANVRNYPALIYKPTTFQGQLVAPPQRNFAEPPIQAIVATIQQFKANVDATTGAYEPSRGNLSSGERSGKALLALQQKSEEGNSGFLESLASVSMTYEGKVVLDLIPHIYDTPGRVARVLGIDNDPESVMLNQPFTRGPDGEPVAVNPEQPPQTQTPGQPPPEVEHYDLKQGVYTVAVSVGKSYTTMRQEQSDAIGAVIQAEPQLLMLIGDIWMRGQDFPEAEDIADRLEKMLPPQLQKDNAQQGIPPQAQAQIAQLTQQVQELSQLADKNKSDLQKTQMEIQSKEKIAAAELEIKQQIAASQAEIDKLKAITDTNVAQMKLETERAKLVMQQNQHALDLQHQEQAADTQRQHELGMTAVGQAHETFSGEAQRRHEQTLAAQKPTPKAGA